MNPNGATEDLAFYTDIEDEVMSNVECIYCCRIKGSSPCFCAQEEDSDMDVCSEMENTDSEDENILQSNSVILHHFNRPDLQVTRIDYGVSRSLDLPPAPRLRRMPTYCPQTDSGDCICTLSD